ncbi:MAG: accessory gene regulator B family protein [Clostridia bacterium]|nr:accessory gene regulator B family protein [Clostridia bacterium]
MVDKVCETLLDKIRKSDTTIDDEKAEIIYYGLQNMIGELPKLIIVFGLAALLGIFKLVVLGTIVLMIYRGFAGGVHLKTHISCLLTSTFLMIGSTYLAKEVIYENVLLVYTILLAFNLIIALLYAPADTENKPIMKESQRKKQKIESILMVFLIYFLSIVVIKERAITNLFMYMITIESLMITPLAYKIFDNKTGDERRKAILEGREGM